STSTSAATGSRHCGSRVPPWPRHNRAPMTTAPRRRTSAPRIRDRTHPLQGEHDMTETNATTASAQGKEPATGLEDVVRSLRRLTRNSRNLATESGDVLERELGMAIQISEQLRDSVFAEESL